MPIKPEPEMLELPSLNDIQDIIKNDDGSYKVIYKKFKSKSGSRLVTASWTEVPHFDKKGNQLEPHKYKQLTIAKNGSQFFAQTESCEFLGSASTLISTERLKLMEIEDPKSQDKFFEGINIYEDVKPNHNYLMGVDPAKDGIDSFAVQVIDITEFPFKQVASAMLDVDYLVMPEHLETLGLYYNEAFIVIENNEGAGQSISDMLYLNYEYPNMYRDRDEANKSYKKFYGFRTTLKTRPLIINMMKIFIEEGKLIVQDRNTIEEFFNFIKSDNIRIKYEAEEGYKDDMIMSLAIAFAPFMHIKAFDDLSMFLEVLRIEPKEDEDGVQTADFYSLLDTGGSGFDNGEETYTREQMLQDASSYDAEVAFNAVRKLNNGIN